jgi:LuxR family maltose regulon positive regulatory protein
MGLALPAQAIAALEQRTEGWIAGLQLAALAMRDRPDQRGFIEAFAGNHRLVLDYLAEEVLAHLPRHLHEFLLQTSILDRLCGPLCDAVLGIENEKLKIEKQPSDVGLSQFSIFNSQFTDSYSQLILDQLERANLFLIPLDDRRQWYRYHHLFGAVLRERLKQGASPATLATLHERASAWFESQWLLPEAIQHALAVQQWQRAAALIEQIGDELLQSGAIDRLQQLIAALPATVRASHPRLLYLQARRARQVYDIVGARALFGQAADGFAAAGDQIGRGDSLIYLADCYRMLGAYADARRNLAEALNGPLTPARRAGAIFSRAYEAAADGDWRNAIALLTDTLELVEQSGELQALYDIAPNLSSILLLLPNGIACARRARALIARAPVAPLSLLGAADLFLSGVVHFADGELSAARDDLGRAIELHQQLGSLSQMRIEMAVWYARCAALLGDFATADEHMDRLIALLDQPELATFRQLWGAIELAMQGWLRWLEGRYDEARACADRAEAQANDSEWPIVERVRRLMRALVLLAERELSEAERLLQDAYAKQRQFRDTGLFADAGLMLAYAYVQQGREADALALLDTILADREDAPSPAILALTGAPIVVPLLRLAIERNVRAASASHLLRWLSDPGATPPDTPAGPDALSARELEVLRQIALGASNGEIAARLVISTTTVKKHINNIFAKLHARSRTQALVHARERGLL